jgi:cell division protein FtsQ
MVRPPAIGLPRLPSIPLPGPRAPSARALALAGILVALLGAAYAVARETAVFAVETVEVTGASPEVEAAARKALAGVVRDSLVALDPADVERRLERIPLVRLASVDRSFPHGLTVRIVGERPLALLRAGSKGWIVSADGRVLREADPRAHPRLPRIRLPADTSLSPGETVHAVGPRLALRLLAALPPRFPARPISAESEGGEASLVVEGWIKVRLGTAIRLEEKLAAAAAVLRSLTPEERAALAYLDASVPERVTAGAKPQPESEG